MSKICLALLSALFLVLTISVDLWHNHHGEEEETHHCLSYQIEKTISSIETAEAPLRVFIAGTVRYDFPTFSLNLPFFIRSRHPRAPPLPASHS